MGKSDIEKSTVSLKSKKEKRISPTKVVIRRLPPSLTEEKLKECLGTLPEHDFFYFVDGKLSFEPVPFSRAYINFVNPDDIIKLRDQFDGFMFTDDRGQHYSAVVEYAPYQGTPRKKNRKDPKCNTIEQDKDYLAFLESLEKEVEPLPSIETHLEELEARKDKNDEKKSTPLLEYLKVKRSNRERARIENRKKRQEKEEAPKTLKKNVQSSKDSKAPPTQREEKNKSRKRADGRDAGRREHGRREEGKKCIRENKDFPVDKDTKPPRSQKDREREGKNRGDSARPNSSAEDRRHAPRRERPDSDRRDNDRGRRSNDRHAEEQLNNAQSDNRSNSKAKESSGKAKGKDDSPKKNEAEKEIACGGTDKRERDREKEAMKKRESDRERDREANRVKNKDRPDRAIYQPRSRAPRPDSAEQGKVEPKVSPDKTQGNENKDREKEKHESKDRDRNRERNSDRHGGRDRERDKERDRYREPKEHERKERDRDRARKKDRDRRSKETDMTHKESKENNQVA